MHIAVLFHFHDAPRPSAVTEVEGSITDIVLPEVGDTIAHTDFEGRRFRGQVLGRHFDYSLQNGEDVAGSITVVLSLKRVSDMQVQ